MVAFLLKVLLFIVIFPECFCGILLFKLRYDAWVLTEKSVSYLLTEKFININRLEKDEREKIIKDFCYVKKRSYYPLGIEIKEITNTTNTDIPHKVYVVLTIDDNMYVY